MADNISLNPGTGGDTIAADDIGGVKHQLVKVEFGAADSATLVSAANPLPVNQPALTASGSLTSTGSVALTLDGQAGAIVDVRGTFTATWILEGLVDNGSWGTISGVKASDQSTVTSSSASGSQIQIAAAGFVGVRVRCSSYSSGTLAITLRAVPASAVAAVQISGNPVLGSSTNQIGDVVPVPRAGSTGPLSRQKILSAGTNNAANIKSSAGRVYGWALQNTSASWRFVKFFNKATTPAPATDTCAFLIALPPGGTVEYSSSFGAYYALGIGVCIVAAAAENDNTAISANDVIGAIDYA